jgi:hypothetical protein
MAIPLTSIADRIVLKGSSEALAVFTAISNSKGVNLSSRKTYCKPCKNGTIWKFDVCGHPHEHIVPNGTRCHYRFWKEAKCKTWVPLTVTMKKKLLEKKYKKSQISSNQKNFNELRVEKELEAKKIMEQDIRIEFVNPKENSEFCFPHARRYNPDSWKY